MGASMSSHFSHPDHHATSLHGRSHPDHHARFRRVKNNSAGSLCGMCNLNVEVGAAAYRCSKEECPFILHDACYRRPQTIRRHFGHQQHSLTLGATNQDHQLCSLCAQGLDSWNFAYSCTNHKCVAGGFRAHPRCCDLPRDISTPLHSHRRLVLQPPSVGNNSNGQQHPRRTCLNCERNERTAAAWSYKCPNCNEVEYCLSCLLGNDDAVRCCGVQCCDVDLEAVHCLGRVAGALFCGFVSGMGCPGFTTQQIKE